MYVLGFVAAYFLIGRQRRAREIGLTDGVTQDLIFYLAVGLVLGARLGYLAFYQYPNAMDYLRQPLEIIATWHGGMSFHGGFLGCLLAGVLFSRRRRLPFWAVADSVIVTAPIGLAAGRIGNFINGELYGRPSQVPWAMVFPHAGPLARHPSQLYEALLEGLILFAILWWLRRRPFRDGMMVAFFLFFYGCFRFLLEFFREPDAQLGFVLGPFSMGQVLCLLMIASALLLAIVLARRPPADSPTMATAGLRGRSRPARPRAIEPGKP
ncbi:MAG: prolipoprotein diacylglyceryl transferase [Syntrophobacteraceae bacterium CG2_30_61_12]|nr:MAG: prolipoprotein diacylglyceryl transferase [Syntrophobacteraceae bacterium CG2_30_61_12]